MKRWKLVTGVIIVFVFGMLMGSLGTGLLYKYRVIRPEKLESSEKKALILKKYAEALELSPHQTAGFEKIIEDMDSKRREFFDKIRPETRRIREQAVLEMKKLLEPHQQGKLDQLHQKFRKEYGKRRNMRY